MTELQKLLCVDYARLAPLMGVLVTLLPLNPSPLPGCYYILYVTYLLVLTETPVNLNLSVLDRYYHIYV